MAEEPTIHRGEILSHSSTIVAAYASNTSVAVDDLPKLIQSVFDRLTALATAEPQPVEPTPAVPVRKSVTPDYLVCLEDGKKLKMLKRYLMTNYDMTPEDYRARWGLKADYPMVAPNYAKKRRELARKIGLGRKRTATAKPPAKSGTRRSRAKTSAA